MFLSMPELLRLFQYGPVPTVLLSRWAFTQFIMLVAPREAGVAVIEPSPSYVDSPVSRCRWKPSSALPPDGPVALSWLVSPAPEPCWTQKIPPGSASLVLLSQPDFAKVKSCSARLSEVVSPRRYCSMNARLTQALSS